MMGPKEGLRFGSPGPEGHPVFLAADRCWISNAIGAGEPAVPPGSRHGLSVLTFTAPRPSRMETPK
jgi:hypothetical protein